MLHNEESDRSVIGWRNNWESKRKKKESERNIRDMSVTETNRAEQEQEYQPFYTLTYISYAHI